MKTVVHGRKLKVGDRIKVINAGSGALGANGVMATVVEKAPKNERISGLSAYRPSLMIKLDKVHSKYFTSYWRVSLDGKYEVQTTKKHIEMDVLIKNNVTKIVAGDKVGVARCNYSEDRFNEAYGVILAVARAYKLDDEKFQAIVDALYDDIKKIEDYNTLELIEELKARVEE